MSQAKSFSLWSKELEVNGSIENKNEMHQDIEINNQIIPPGKKTIMKVVVGRLPSDTKIHINLHIYRSENPGPTMLVLAGVHGDEINGVEIVRRAIESNLFEGINHGTIIAVPILNIYGFINFSREVPDGKDVNRSFPGNMRGSLASRVARILTKKVLPHVNFGIDFHTGGASRYNYPQIRYTGKDEESRKMAVQFGGSYIIKKTLIPRSLRKSAHDMGIPMLVFEGGESLRLDGLAISKATDGLKRLLFEKGYIDEAPEPDPEIHDIKKTSWIRASHSGIFTWTKSSGKKVFKDEPLGIINDADGTKTIKILATKDGYIIGHNNTPVVNQGDALFHIGYADEKIIL
jgi:predicted deacylase